MEALFAISVILLTCTTSVMGNSIAETAEAIRNRSQNSNFQRPFGISDVILGGQSRHHQQCQPDPRSPQLQRRSLCPFEIQRDYNPHRVPDVILRSHCLCESSPCSSAMAPQQPARCVSLVSPLKVAYLDPQLRFVVSTEVVHVPVACICAAQPPGRHMPQARNIVVWMKISLAVSWIIRHGHRHNCLFIPPFQQFNSYHPHSAHFWLLACDSLVEKRVNARVVRLLM